ncbi:hypothetical protein SFC65_19210 [Priestia filamentosa]
MKEVKKANILIVLSGPFLLSSSIVETVSILSSTALIGAALNITALVL